MGSEVWTAVLVILVAVIAADRLFRRYFRQEGDRTVGKRQRGPQSDWKQPTGEVIDTITGDAGREERPHP